MRPAAACTLGVLSTSLLRAAKARAAASWTCTGLEVLGKIFITYSVPCIIPPRGSLVRDSRRCWDRRCPVCAPISHCCGCCRVAARPARRPARL
jgi:hypothetical protein